MPGDFTVFVIRKVTVRLCLSRNCLCKSSHMQISEHEHQNHTRAGEMSNQNGKEKIPAFLQYILMQ